MSSSSFFSKPVKKPATQLELDHERLLKQEQMLRKDMGKQRVKQLKMANEDEDKTIHRLEKLLKINKSKSKKGIPNMFNDGLDYALEMCLPENVEKMYAAAKEAADAEQQSDSEWQEDFAVATGDADPKPIEKSYKKATKSKPEKSKSTAKKASAPKKVSQLRQIDSDDELASDLSDMDSEFERSDNDSELADTDLDDFENGIDSEDDDDDDDVSDFDENVDDDDDDAPEEIHTVTKSSNKRRLEKLKAKSAQKSESSDENESDNESNDLDMNSSDADSDGEPEQKVRKNMDNMDSDVDNDSDESDESHQNEEKPDIWEDIYGRKRDKQGNVITESSNETGLSNDTGKYIPPHLRARMAAEAANGMADVDVEMDPKRKEKLMRLKRLLKGQLNRLSEANMHKISSEIDSLYMQNSRYDMNTTLTILISDALISHALAAERMVMEHALLVAALHANVGTEVGANMLENLVDRFHKMLQHGIDQYDVEDKTLDNVLFFLCHMYTFKVNAESIQFLIKFIFQQFCDFFFRNRFSIIVWCTIFLTSCWTHFVRNPLNVFY